MAGRGAEWAAAQRAVLADSANSFTEKAVDILTPCPVHPPAVADLLTERAHAARTARASLEIGRARIARQASVGYCDEPPSSPRSRAASNASTSPPSPRLAGPRQPPPPPLLAPQPQPPPLPPTTLAHPPRPRPRVSTNAAVDSEARRRASLDWLAAARGSALGSAAAAAAAAASAAVANAPVFAEHHSNICVGFCDIGASVWEEFSNLNASSDSILLMPPPPSFSPQLVSRRCASNPPPPKRWRCCTPCSLS